MIASFSRYDDFLELKDVWNELLQSSEESDNVFLRHEWFDSWWQAFGAGRELLVLLAYSEGQLIGAAPLMLYRDRYKGVPYRRLGFIEDPNAPSMNFIVRKGGEERACALFTSHLLNDLGRLWHAAILNKLPVNGKTCRSLTGHLGKNRVRFMCRESMRSPYIRTDSDWDAFLKSTDVKFRKQLRNKKNKLSKAGKVTIEEHTTHSPAVLEEVFSVSAKSWKHREGTSMVSTPERRRFFERLSSVASREGWLSIWLLRLDGRPIALEYHLKHQGRTHGMRGDFDEAYREVSPGSVLEAHIIEHCFTHELKEYDFCGLDYRYKTKWTDLVHPTVNLLVYNENFRSLSIYAMQKYLPLVKGIIEKK